MTYSSYDIKIHSFYSAGGWINIPHDDFVSGDLTITKSQFGTIRPDDFSPVPLWKISLQNRRTTYVYDRLSDLCVRDIVAKFMELRKA